MKEQTKFSNFDVCVISKELNASLSEGTIANVYEIEELLILKISTKSNEKVNLIVKNDSRVNLTNYKYPIPKFPSQFIISLRKLLKNRKIKSISQYDFDRIIRIELESYEEESQEFIIELFNKGNFVFINGNKIVKMAKSYRKFKNREILPNKIYEFPKSSSVGFLNIKKSEFLDLIINSKDQIVRFLAKVIGISGLYSEEICLRAGLEKSKETDSLTQDQKDSLFLSIKTLRNQLLFGEIIANIVYNEEGQQISVFPLDLQLFKNFEKKYFKTFNQAVDEYYSKLDAEILKKPEDQDLKNKIEAQKRILKSQEQYIEELKNKKVDYYKYGDFIYSHFNSLEKLFNVISNAKKKGYNIYEINETLLKAKRNNLNGSELFERIIPQKGEIVIKTNSNSIHLKLNKSIGENANKIYFKGKKAEQKIKGTLEAIKNTKDKINKLEKSKNKVEERVQALVKKRKRAWYEKFRWFVSSDGYLVIGGRDASSNESIFKKHIDPDDLVFHTNYPGSPLAVIKSSDSKNVPEATMKETANFVASYSSAWKEDWGYIDVFYVFPSQVSKTPPTGEYLPKGSFMITGKKNIIKDAKTELSVGLELIESKNDSENVVYNLKILCGPLNALSSKLDYVLTIKPSKSGYSKGTLAKKIKEKFIDHFDEPIKKWIKLLNEDELILYLPAGKSKIVN